MIPWKGDVGFEVRHYLIGSIRVLKKNLLSASSVN